mmetsp:Transcript_90909/g.271366  ORF Transcript_90909/g.271366 Transcript_90909/m.271366 type:complete len:89 (-) Transcript_90909:1887-2153(-)
MGAVSVPGAAMASIEQAPGAGAGAAAPIGLPAGAVAMACICPIAISGIGAAAGICGMVPAASMWSDATACVGGTGGQEATWASTPPGL